MVIFVSLGDTKLEVNNAGPAPISDAHNNSNCQYPEIETDIRWNWREIIQSLHNPNLQNVELNLKI